MKKLTNEMKDKKLFLLDIDGTVACDSSLYEGSQLFFDEVLKQGGKYIFITNNSTKSIKDYVDKFTKMGVKVDESNFITSSYATARYLKAEYDNNKIFVVGTESFVKELKDFGLQVTEEIEDNIVAAVVGFDNELRYQKIHNICELLQTRDIEFIGTNPDLVCPVGFGFIPDCGSICNMIAEAVHQTPLYVGKPNPMIVDMCLEEAGFSKEETVVIGDRLYTDIACGINGEVDSVVVFTGEAKAADLTTTEFPPTYFCDNIMDVFHSLCNN